MEGVSMFHFRVDEDITLELQSPEHDEALFSLLDANREFISVFLSWANKTQTIEDMRDYMQRDLRGMAESRRWAWLIRYKEQPAGRIGIFMSVPVLRECELYYWLGREFTGKGIVTRAARVITDYAFRELNMNHMLIGFSGKNHKSGAVAERLGFQYEVNLRDNECHQDKWHDLHFWGVLADSWKTQYQPTFTYPIQEDIHLRLHQIHHAPIQYELMQGNLPDLKRWFWWAAEHNLDRERDYTQSMLRKYAEGGGLMVGIWDDDELLGSAALQIDKQKSEAQIGYWLDYEARGEGIITRTAKALMHYTFDIRGLERFCLRSTTENKASRAVAERLALQQEAIFREEEFIDGRYIDHVQYSMLKNEWQGL
jgi:ribosomal-protein-serine acetyltransferase